MGHRWIIRFLPQEPFFKFPLGNLVEILNVWYVTARWREEAPVRAPPSSCMRCPQFGEVCLLTFSASRVNIIYLDAHYSSLQHTCGRAASFVRWILITLASSMFSLRLWKQHKYQRTQVYSLSSVSFYLYVQKKQTSPYLQFLCYKYYSHSPAPTSLRTINVSDLQNVLKQFPFPGCKIFQ